jgi:hypothetical protein
MFVAQTGLAGRCTGLGGGEPPRYGLRDEIGQARHESFTISFRGGRLSDRNQWQARTELPTSPEEALGPHRKIHVCETGKMVKWHSARTGSGNRAYCKLAKVAA